MKIVELGSRISPDDLAREQWTASLETQGLPPRAIGPFEEMIDSYNVRLDRLRSGRRRAGRRHSHSHPGFRSGAKKARGGI